MSRRRTWLFLLGLALATPLLSGCLTSFIVREVAHKLSEHKSKHDADGSRAKKKHESGQRPDSAGERREAPEQPERSY